MKMSALTLTHNLIASRVVTKEEPLLAPIWDCVYAMAIKSSTAKTSKAETPSNSQMEDDQLSEMLVEVREEAINVVREFISTFTGTCSCFIFFPNIFLVSFSLEMTLSMTDLEALVSFSTEHSSTISSYTKVNIVRIMATVGSSTVARHCAAPTEPVAQLVEQITALLLAGFNSASADLVLRAEILDSLIDVYSDDNALTTSLFKRLNLLGTLKGIAGEYRRQVRFNVFKSKQN